ncbi:MAG TPA: C39 family peptidase, partial [Planctomycetota bacterium]|nr:C39 family peptidase [Planctomycetota bacterium]
MNRLEPGKAMPVATLALERVRKHYHDGQFLKAYEAGKELGPLDTWQGPEGRIMAGRLAWNLGADRLGLKLHILAHREWPENAEALYFYVHSIHARRGPLRAWQILRAKPDLPDALPSVRADWLALHAGVVGTFRDFDAAEHWLALAERVAPDRPWLWIERARLFELEDRYEDSLAAARRALEIRPWYRPAVLASAHGLMLLSRDDEALELLSEADHHLESAHVARMLASVQMELHRNDGALVSLARFEALAPLLEKHERTWLLAARSDCLWRLGREEEALELAKLSKSPFHEKLVERAAKTTTSKRVLLPVGFVRQHWKTCSPATLSAIGRYWSVPVDHLEVTETICYDGTPSVSERRWAEEHGWVAREHTVTVASARALLDRGVPFVFTTVAPGNAHAQAIIGYDERRGTIVARDPFLRGMGEWVADAIVDAQRSTGPRGMALVPEAKRELLDGLDLPDAELWDGYYRVERALAAHDRVAAVTAAEDLAKASSGHRLAHFARRAIAAYDADPEGMLAATEKLLELYPKDQVLELVRLGCLRDLARKAERIRALEQLVADPATHPIFWEILAGELLPDARSRDRVRWLARRALRRNPTDPRALGTMADLLWDERRTDEALELYRFAACVADKDEGRAFAYFQAASRARQTGAGIFFLENRFQRFAKRSGDPARTLFAAYASIARGSEAFAALDRALAVRGDDSGLLLFAAESHARHGQMVRARSLLEEARSRSRPGAFKRAAATISSHDGDLRGALELWREVLAIEPLALDAHQEVARLTAEVGGRADALRHLDDALARFPHHLGLRRLAVSWCEKDDPATHEAMVRKLLDSDPADAWAHRELAMALARGGKLDEALAEAEQSLTLAPNEPPSHGVRAEVLGRKGAVAEAREELRAALRLDVEYAFAIAKLVGLGATAAEKQEDLAFVRAELARQASHREAALTFRDVASGVVPGVQLLAWLEELRESRPDLWTVRATIVATLLQLGRADDARTVAKTALEQFPFQAMLWRDLALVERA